jgi:hypothetical protein
MLISVGLAGFNLLGSQSVYAQSATQKAVAQCDKGFFGLEPWYQYIGVELSTDGKCEVKCFNVFDQGPGVGEPPNTCGQQKSDIPLILLAVVDDLLRIAGIAAVAFIIYGAFEYIGSQGNSEVTGRAQSMIINALVGLVVAIIAVAAIGYIGNHLGG